MKRIIKLLAVVTTLIITLMALTACGDSKNETSSKEQSTESNVSNPVEEQSSSSTKFIDDNESYYFIYDGVKIKAGDEMSSISSANLSVRDTQREKEINSKSYSTIEITNAKDTSVFNATAYNKDSSTVTVLDSWVGGLHVDTRGVSRDEKVADMEVYGGIKVGSTIEELKSVFGEPDEESSSDDEYVYESKEVSRYYRFDIKDGKVTGITWMNRTF